MKFKPIEELTFTDDFMFGYVLHNPEICKELLEQLLQIKIDHVEYPKLQETINSYYDSKGVRLDVYVKDSDKETKALMNFNKMVTEDERLDNLIIPIRDGLMVARKK